MIDKLLAEWPPSNAASILLSFIALSFVYYLGQSVYDVYFGPLSNIPGPKLNAFSILPAIITNHYGNESIDVPALHAKYGPLIRLNIDILRSAASMPCELLSSPPSARFNTSFSASRDDEN